MECICLTRLDRLVFLFFVLCSIGVYKSHSADTLGLGLHNRKFYLTNRHSWTLQIVKEGDAYIANGTRKAKLTEGEIQVKPLNSFQQYYSEQFLGLPFGRRNDSGGVGYASIDNPLYLVNVALEGITSHQYICMHKKSIICQDTLTDKCKFKEIYLPNRYIAFCQQRTGAKRRWCCLGLLKDGHSGAKCSTSLGNLTKSAQYMPRDIHELQQNHGFWIMYNTPTMPTMTTTPTLPNRMSVKQNCDTNLNGLEYWKQCGRKRNRIRITERLLRRRRRSRRE